MERQLMAAYSGQNLSISCVKPFCSNLVHLWEYLLRTELSVDCHVILTWRRFRSLFHSNELVHFLEPIFTVFSLLSSYMCDDCRPHVTILLLLLFRSPHSHCLSVRPCVCMYLLFTPSPVQFSTCPVRQTDRHLQQTLLFPSTPILLSTNSSSDGDGGSYMLAGRSLLPPV